MDRHLTRQCSIAFRSTPRAGSLATVIHRWSPLATALSLTALCVATGRAAEPDRTMIEALHPYHGFIGSWKGDGSSPTSTGWTETTEVTWGFRESDGRVSFNFYVEKGQAIKVAILTYDPKTELFRFIAVDPKDNKLLFEGKASDKKNALVLDRADKDYNDKLDRFELRLVRSGDKLIYAFSRKKGKTLYEAHTAVELFRQGESYEQFAKNPPCVVTGAPSRLQVEHNGKSYSVACEACKEEFEAHPDRYANQ